MRMQSTQHLNWRCQQQPTDSSAQWHGGGTPRLTLATWVLCSRPVSAAKRPCSAGHCQVCGCGGIGRLDGGALWPGDLHWSCPGRVGADGTSAALQKGPSVEPSKRFQRASGTHSVDGIEVLPGAADAETKAYCRDGHSSTGSTSPKDMIYHCGRLGAFRAMTQAYPGKNLHRAALGGAAEYGSIRKAGYRMRASPRSCAVA